MNVFENIAFGLNIKKMDKNVIRQKVERGAVKQWGWKAWEQGCHLAVRRPAAARGYCAGACQ